MTKTQEDVYTEFRDKLQVVYKLTSVNYNYIHQNIHNVPLMLLFELYNWIKDDIITKANKNGQVVLINDGKFIIVRYKPKQKVLIEIKSEIINLN